MYKDSGELGFLHCTYHADELVSYCCVPRYTVLKFVYEYLLHLRST